MSQIKVDSIVPRGGIPAGADGGAIIQVVQYVQSAQVSQTVTTGRTNWQDLTGFSLNITPGSANNKVLVSCNLRIGGNGGQFYQMSSFRITRGGSVITDALGDSQTNFEQATMSHCRGPHDNNGISHYAFQYIDSPSTTSSTNYKIQVQAEGSPVYINRTANNNSNTIYSLTSISTLNLMEISG